MAYLRQRCVSCKLSEEATKIMHSGAVKLINFTTHSFIDGVAGVIDETPFLAL